MRPLVALSLLALGACLENRASADTPTDPPAVAAQQRKPFGWFRRQDPAPQSKPPVAPARKPAPSPPNPPAAAAPKAKITTTTDKVAPTDPPVRRVQGTAGEIQALPPGSIPITPPESSIGSQSLSLQAALYGALTSNPDLVSLRQGNVPGNAASPEAVEVARHFPTTLNPTLWIDVRPLVYERNPGHGPQEKDALYYFSLRQPIELGHQNRYRYEIAKSSLNQQHWTVVQAELLALVQTYRFFQTAAYRREKLRVARNLADFNDRLVQTLKRRIEANQITADAVLLAEVESQATRQLVKAAKQDYARALTDLRNQLGTPETAATAEPFGEFVLPAYIPQIDEQAFIETALENRAEIRAARAAIDVARAAAGLARADRIPTPVTGPVYERDEQGTQFFGFVFITPIPVVNNGAPLVRQREAEYRRACGALQQLQLRTVAQVKAALANWNEANELSNDTRGLTAKLEGTVASLERLFEAGQTDLTKLLQARQRLIQLENAELDAIWQATQAQADLLTALGAPSLMAALREQEGAAGATAVPPLSIPDSASPFRPR